MKATDKQFLAAIDSSATISQAAQQLGMAPQSVSVRLARLKRCGVITDVMARKDFSGVSNRKLEERYFAHLESGDYEAAAGCFAEMCDRLEKPCA